MKPRVYVMAKLAVLGRVKTRLGREIGAVEALRFYRATRRAVLLRLAADRRFEVCLALDPAHQRDRTIPASVRQIGQRRGDLGHRMSSLLRAPGANCRFVIGTDIPCVRPGHIASASALLRGRHAVIGPAADGGFWLFGARRCPRVLAPFAGVRWSHADTRDDVIRRLGAAQWALADWLNDVDTRDDYDRHRPILGRVVLPRLADRREV